MPKRSRNKVSVEKPAAKPPRPKNKQDAADVDRAVAEGMGQPQELSEPEPAKKKDPAAVALGRKGGLKGGVARAAKLTKEQRSESAREAAKARWKNKSAD